MPRSSSEQYQPPHSQELHDRAHASMTELRGHVVTMATGVLAVFYFSLTRASEARLPLVTVALSVGVVVARGSRAVFAGLWAAFADGRWSYVWAKFIEREALNETSEAPVTERPSETVSAQEWEARRDWWSRQKRSWEYASLSLFAVGMLLTSVYLVIQLTSAF